MGSKVCMSSETMKCKLCFMFTEFASDNPRLSEENESRFIYISNGIIHLTTVLKLK